MGRCFRAFQAFGARGALCALLACVDGQVTELRPEGPPEILQLIVTERFRPPSGPAENRFVIAYGSHPDASAAEQHPVSNAAVIDQRVRVVVDELMAGHTVEEVRCVAPVDEDDFSRLPPNATIDDITRCIGDPAVLASRCLGDRAICVRQSDGVPVGILDRVNHVGQARPDGIADTLRFIAGAASFRCTHGGVDRSIAIDQVESYYQPAGTQQRPDVDDGARGFLLLGPALALEPVSALPSSSRCHPVFAPEVVDKSGERPCAGWPCVPGDTSAAAFDTEPLELVQATPASGATGVPRNLEIMLRTSVPLGAAPLVTVAPPAPITVVFSASAAQQVTVRTTAMLSPQTTYTFSLTLRDAFGIGPAAPVTVVYTTGGAPTTL